MTNIRLVDIAPPPYKDPATMLRLIADEIEAGDHSPISTIVVCFLHEDGISATFGGGKNSEFAHIAFALGTAHTKMLNGPSHRLTE